MALGAATRSRVANLLGRNGRYPHLCGELAMNNIAVVLLILAAIGAALVIWEAVR